MEIRPSFKPILLKHQGYNMEMLGVLDKEGPIRAYDEHGVNLHNIEDVDDVLRNSSYSQPIGRSDYYDFIIAPHVIEHILDIVGFFLACIKLLKPYGDLSPC